MDVSIVIPVCAETRLERTIVRIKKTCPDLPELVLVFDGDPAKNYAIDYPEDLLVIVENETRLGTGPSRDIGVMAASNDLVVTTDGHVDWRDGSNWAEEIRKEHEKHPKDVLCCVMRVLTPNALYIHDESPRHAGATLVLRSRGDLEPGNSIFKARWTKNEIGVISVCMGACYAISKKRYIEKLNRPWKINKGWGHDEQTISVINWICGGDTRLIDVESGHARDKGQTKKPAFPDQNGPLKTISNRIAMAHYLPMSELRRRSLLSWAKTDSTYGRKEEKINAIIDWDAVAHMKKHLSKQERNFDDFVREFDCIDFVIGKQTIFSNPVYDPDLCVPVDAQVAISTLPRSGSHMVSDWVASQLCGKVRHASAMDVAPQRINEPRCFSKPDALRTLPTGTAGEGSAITWIYTYERSLPSRSFLPWMQSVNNRKILLLRSCHNWCASFTSLCKNIPPGELQVNTWCEYAMEWLDPRVEGVRIYYDRFILDKDYRDSIAEQLDIDVRSDRSLSRVSPNAGGSSFDRTEYDGNADQMKTLERWREYENEEWMQKILNDPFVAEIQRAVEVI